MSELALDDMSVPGDDQLETIRAAGYAGLQLFTDIDPERVAACRRLGLALAGSGRVNKPEEAGPLAAQLANVGMVAGTLHVGWGIEDDAEAHALIEAILKASEQHRIPLYVETHRATIFQDMWRTVQFARAWPDLRFNGDFSHWYTGQEMVYGNFDDKLAFIAPVLERIRFLHGRIGNPGCIQVDIGDGSEDGRPFVGHFRRLWTAAMRGFVASASPDDVLVFSPELLASRIYYQQSESDRWEQSLVLCRIAKECFQSCIDGRSSA
jgi:sugar phosphate isomerase/epimerase